VTYLVAVAEDVQRILALEHLLHEVGTTWLMASSTLPLSTSTSDCARISPMPTQLNGRSIVYGNLYVDAQLA
jgi:hypothetical protein